MNESKSLGHVTGFLMATLAQAAFITLSDFVGLSSLTSGFIGPVLLIFIVLGQVAGWSLFLLNRAVSWLPRLNRWLTGTIYGLAIWAITAPLISSLGAMTPLWYVGSNLIVSTTSYVIFGIIASLTLRYNERVST